MKVTRISGRSRLPTHGRRGYGPTMGNIGLIRALVVALCFCGIPAMSAELTGEAQELGWFAGSWACEGKRFVETGEQPFRASYDFVAVAGGAWLETHYQETASEQNPMPLDIREFWGHDAPAGAFRNNWVNNFAMSGSFSSPGWQGDDFIWATDAFPMGGAMRPMRATFHRSGANSFNVEPTFGAGDGNWRPIATFSCSRRP